MVGTIQSVGISGGATQSIFLEVEALLGDTDFQKALEYVAARKKMDKYHSVIDFLFCELNTEWQVPCMRFYADKGPQLKELLTDKQIESFDKKLVVALNVAHTLFSEQRCKSWVGYKFEVRKVLQAAA